MQIPTASILCLLASTLVAIGVPVALVIFGKVRYHIALKPVVTGALCFVIGAMVLESLMHQLVFRLVPTLPLRPWLYVAYGALAAGVFEEVARFVGLKALCRFERPDLRTGFAYGIGHGGIESILLMGATGISSLALMVTVNRAGAENLLSTLEGAQRTAMEAQLAAAAATPSWQYLLGGYERLVAITLHLALSILVWMAAAGWLPKAFLGISILLHALADVPAAMAQVGLLGNLLLVEALTTLVTVYVVWYVHTLYKRAKKHAEMHIAPL